jgi:tetratricopeptide (TPR) repeat protein
VIIGAVMILVVYPQIQAKYHWEQAKKLISNNDLTRAENHLDDCLKVWSTDGEVHFLMARTCRRNGDPDRARDNLQKAKRFHWVPAEIKLENLLAKAQIGYKPELAKQLQAILEEGHQDDIFIFEALIIGCIQTKFLTEGYRWASVWIEQHPDDWLGRYWHGAVLEAASQYVLAKEQYLIALELNPSGFGTHVRLAEVLMQEKASHEAIGHYEAALASDPENATALFGLARCQHSLGSNEVTKATLDRLIALNPKHIGAYALYSQLADEEDRLEEALQWLKKARDIDPNDRGTNQRLFDVLRRLNRDQEAKEIQRRTQEQERQFTRLEEITKEILNQPKDILLRNEAGNILLQLGKHDDAFRWFVSAWLLDSRDQTAKDGMQKCVQKTGNKELLERYKFMLSERP